MPELCLSFFLPTPTARLLNIYVLKFSSFYTTSINQHVISIITQSAFVVCRRNISYVFALYSFLFYLSWFISASKQLNNQIIVEVCNYYTPFIYIIYWIPNLKYCTMLSRTVFQLPFLKPIRICERNRLDRK